MNYVKKCFYLFLPILSGSLIGLLTSSFIDYGVLKKPPLAPPSYLFPIIWSIIFILLGVSYFLYREKDNNEQINKVYYGGLIVNLLWSIFFFVFKWRLFTCLWTIILLLLVIYLLKLFYDNNHKWSFYLNIPYLVWLIFATYLTIGIYFLN